MFEPSGCEAKNTGPIHKKLTLKGNKRGACALIDCIKAALVICLSLGRSYGQDTVPLSSVEIVAKKVSLSQIGKKTLSVDSLTREQFRFNSVGDLLSFNSPVFIKSYGPGAIATTAFRGGNASQTAVLWNGFNLQNAMLGQSDLALMPSILFEDVELEFGGSASLWGSGAVGGSIHLNNSTPFNKGLSASVNASTGSTGTRNGSALLLLSKRRLVSSTKLYEIVSKNSFLYRDTSDRESPLKRQAQAGYNFKGLMQELKFIINSRQIVAMNAWVNGNQRRLPPVNPATPAKMYQYDGALRLTASWNYITSRFRSMVRTALLRERIDYTDSLAAIFSVSKVQTVIAENENFFQWRSNQQLNLGLNFSSSSANVQEYDGRKKTDRLSFLIGNRSSFLRSRLVTYVCARAEYFSAGALPVTGNISVEYALTKKIRGKVNTARVYRQPTLNDLYWLPGGNSHLKPEQGYTTEGELSYATVSGRLTFFFSGAAYSRKISNWILWVPGANANPSPLNVQKVWSRGTETVWKAGYQYNKFSTGLSVQTGYCLSTTEENSQENNAAQGRQLIYTPRYTVNNQVYFMYKTAGLFFYHQYVGYRFTSSDNSTWLPPYHASSLKLRYSRQINKINLALYAACNNLFNSNYTIITGRPMPLRNFELGITIKI